MLNCLTTEFKNKNLWFWRKQETNNSYENFLRQFFQCRIQIFTFLKILLFKVFLIISCFLLFDFFFLVFLLFKEHRVTVWRLDIHLFFLHFFQYFLKASRLVKIWILLLIFLCVSLVWRNILENSCVKFLWADSINAEKIDSFNPEKILFEKFFSLTLCIIVKSHKYHLSILD